MTETPAAADAAPAVRVRGLGKRYGSHVALSGVDLDLAPGRVHVLFGENGAGKSTLISMLAGAGEPSSGTIEVGAHCGAFASVAEARDCGVRAVFQELSLIPQLTVADNITLGEEPTGRLGLLSKSAALVEARRVVADLGFDLQAETKVDHLPRGKQQMVEICKAVRASPRLLILDEPTASLSEHDTQALFALVRRLKAAGTAIVYITHRLHEIAQIGDEVTVLRDGRQVGTVPADTRESRLVELMTGRAVSDIYPTLSAVPARAAVRLALRDLDTRDGTVAGASVEVRSGEIVGIGGLVGCGKSELAQACFGLRRIGRGELLVDGRARHFSHPADAIASGVWYSPPDRKRDGLALMRPARENIALSSLTFGDLAGRLLRRRRESALVGRLSRKVDFPTTRIGEPVANFSGGNQQKALLAKGLAQDVAVYLFDEPTVGVDMGARRAIYDYLAELAAAGAAILLVSSDLPELMGLAHRLLVMRGGRLVAEFDRADFDESRILEQFFE
ncbi:MAG: sugar ABC transporter ATP-binding protein [Piscinibacter sp.]|nr:sugar ABC transporter ATP-binding protein [Piscinibacter sp.]